LKWKSETGEETRPGFRTVTVPVLPHVKVQKRIGVGKCMCGGGHLVAAAAGMEGGGSNLRSVGLDLLRASSLV
jgi:hypothetical protein